MAKRVLTSGLNEVLTNLNKEVKAIEGRTLGGLISGAVIVAYDVVNGPLPAVPVDTGNLQNSWFITASGGKGVQMGKSAKFKGDNSAKLASDHSNVISAQTSAVNSKRRPTVAMGFTAFYAWYVHEMVDANFQRPKIIKKGGKLIETPRKPTAGAKFLEASIKRCKNRILEEIRSEAKIK